MTEHTQEPNVTNMTNQETAVINSSEPTTINTPDPSDTDDNFVLEEVLEQNKEGKEEKVPEPEPTVQEEKASKPEEIETLDQFLSEFEDSYNLPEKKKTATQSYSTSTSEKVGSPDTVSIPPTPWRDADSLIKRLPNAMDFTMSAPQRKWIESLQYGFQGNSALIVTGKQIGRAHV